MDNLVPNVGPRSRSSASSSSSLSSSFSTTTFSTNNTSPPPSTRRTLTDDFFATPHRAQSPTSITTHTRAPSTGSESSFTSSYADARLPTPPPSTAAPPLRRGDTLVPFTHTDDTPRLPTHEPQLLRFERSLLLAAQKPKDPERELNQESVSNDTHTVLDDDSDPEDVTRDPQPGTLLSLPTPELPKSSQLPLSPLSTTFSVITSPSTSLPDLPQADDKPSTPTLTVSSPNHYPDSLPTQDLPAVSTLRLTRKLGHGAFSDVWLAEDFSPVPLTLVSKKSVRDLRRRASGRERRDTAVLAENHLQASDESKETHLSHLHNDDDTAHRPTPSKLRDALKSILSFSRPATTHPSSITAAPEPPSSLLLSDPLVKDTATLQPHDPTQPNTPTTRSTNAAGFVPYKGPSRNTSFRVRDGTLSRDSSLRKLREQVRGTRPALRLEGGRVFLDERDGIMGKGLGLKSDGASLSRNSSLGVGSKGCGRLLAVKMTPRKVRSARGREREEEERTRVGFVREVEILKHISHPNITPLLAHLSTPSHHVLVLPFLPGGDLLGLVNNDVAWGKLGESILRRIWCELCKAVGWMHGVGLVHRDIKLENILLTTPAFIDLTPHSPRPTLSSIPLPPAPFIKLTDFGLSRFVELDDEGNAELLSTRCGSEAYAAPELITGGRGPYDARQTDAWACGAVLFAMVARRLPFGEGGAGGRGAMHNGGEKGRIGGERSTMGFMSVSERRQWLMKIAMGEYEWPGDNEDEDDDNGEAASAGGMKGSSSSSGPADTPLQHAHEDGHKDEDDELVGPGLIRSQGAKRIVARLLVRDVKKRAKIADLWDDEWMWVDEDEYAYDWWKRNNEEEIKAQLNHHNHHQSQSALDHHLLSVPPSRTRSDSTGDVDMVSPGPATPSSSTAPLPLPMTRSSSGDSSTLSHLPELDHALLGPGGAIGFKLPTPLIIPHQQHPNTTHSPLHHQHRLAEWVKNAQIQREPADGQAIGLGLGLGLHMDDSGSPTLVGFKHPEEEGHEPKEEIHSHIVRPIHDLEVDEEEDEEDEGEGWILDQEGIDNIARQEVV